jgi:CheY-like chemotaxis protein
MVYGMVQQHQGAITVESEVNRGTNFKLYLPCAESNPLEINTGNADIAVSKTETILVAEDDPSMQRLANHILKGAGYTVLIAIDGEQAVRLFEEHRAEISLVVLDVMMPKRTGPQVYRYLRSIDSDIKIMFCTGFDQGSDELDGLDQENIPRIRKPFNKKFFLSKVREVLNSPVLCNQD